MVPDYSGHTDADREENAGAIAAVIIGVVIMLVFVGFLLYNYMMKKKAREMNSARNGQPHILVNQTDRSNKAPD